MCVLQELNDAIACMGTLNPKIRKRGLCHVRASKHENRPDWNYLQIPVVCLSM